MLLGMTSNEPPPYPGQSNEPTPPPSYGSTPPPAGGYPPPGGGYPPPAAPGGYGAPLESNKKALWSMILGIISILCCGLVTGPIAIVLANQAKGEIAATGGVQPGAGQAKAGFILGIIGIVLWVLGLIARVAIAAGS